MSKNTNIVQELRSGDNKKAIAELYQSFPPIRKFVLYSGGDDADAKDVFQEALMVLYRNAQKAEFELTCAAGTYLYSVSRFLWKDMLKKRSKEVLFDSEMRTFESVEMDVECYKEQESKTLQLKNILQELGDKCSQLLKAYYYEKMSMQEIAQLFEYGSVNSAKTQKYKCIERAKKMATNSVTSSSKL